MNALLGEYLSDAWRDLERRETASGWAAIRLPESPVERELLLAIDENKGRHLLVPAGPGRYDINTQSPLSVDVADLKFHFGDTDAIEGRYLDVSCRVPKLNEQFDGVVESVLDSIESAADPARRAAATVNSWRRLFATMASARQLSLNEKFAIFAELLILDQLELENDSFSAEWWTGPSSAAHDFELPRVSIEVKAIGDSSRAISIHGLEQLEEVESKPLYLVVVGLEESSEGQTVGSFLDSIVSRSPNGEEIRRKAASQGVFATSEDTTKLRLTQVRVAKIDKTFPRLTSEQLSEPLQKALDRVQYDLLLDSIQPSFDFIELRELGNIIEN